MSWPKVKLQDVAPSRPVKKKAISPEANVWQLNLDAVEAQTGRVTAKEIVPLKNAGSSTHWFGARHVLYSKLRPYLNKVVLPDQEGVATTELVPLLPVPELLDRDYLAYYLRSNSFVSWVSQQVAGAKMPRVSMKAFWEHEIPLPPLDEQKRIAAILDKADAIRRKRQQAIQLADDFLKSVFLDMFGDPVTNPKGWEVRSFSDVCKCSQGIQVDSELQKDSAENGYVKFLRIINYTQTSKEFKFIPAPSTTKALINKDEIVMVRYGATAGFVGRGLDGVLANNLFKISFEKSVLDNEYFYYLLNSDYFQNILRNNKKGGAMPAISFGQLNDIEIITPSLELQSKFSQIVNMISGIKEHSLHSESLSNDSFKALSQKAFAGEL